MTRSLKSKNFQSSRTIKRENPSFPPHYFHPLQSIPTQSNTRPVIYLLIYTVLFFDFSNLICVPKLWRCC